jgi:arabinose-5-phosphate isomerase
MKSATTVQSITNAPVTGRGVRADAHRALELAAEVLTIESQAILGAKARLDEDFIGAVQAVLDCHGRVVVTGMGKSGHVGRKIAATLASTGTPALFLHPAEASHGDLGMITSDDVLLALSNSGESDELNVILPAIKRLRVTLIAITGRPESSLGRFAEWVLASTVEQEACPLNLAPTASTTAQLALGDALAVALLDARGFRKEDFALSHPAGRLGRRLLVHVRDLMRTGSALPVVSSNEPLPNMLREMSSKGLGFVAIAESNRLEGIFTDGDLRRLIERGGELRALSAREVMHRQPRTIHQDVLAAEAATLMELHRITSVLVVDADGALIGALNANDLLRAKVI